LTGNRFEMPVNGRKPETMVIIVNQLRFQSKNGVVNLLAVAFMAGVQRNQWNGQQLRFTSSALTYNAIFVKVKNIKEKSHANIQPGASIG